MITWKGYVIGATALLTLIAFYFLVLKNKDADTKIDTGEVLGDFDEENVRY